MVRWLFSFNIRYTYTGRSFLHSSRILKYNTSPNNLDNSIIYNTNESISNLQLLPYDSTIQVYFRRNSLLLFAFAIAPLTLYFYNTNKYSLCHIADININYNEIKDNTSNIVSNSSLFLMISAIKKYIPKWIVTVFYVIIILLVILKLFGYSFIDIFIDMNLLYKISFVSLTICLSYHFLTLYLLHKFSSKEISIPKVLPHFIIEWLEHVKYAASNEVDLKEVRKTCYIDISIYLVLLISLILYG